MKKYLCLLFLIIAFSSNTVAKNSQLKELGIKGIELAYNMEFEKANALFDTMIIAEPENAQGYFLKSAGYFWRFGLDVQNEELGETFKNLSFKAIEIAEEILDKNEDDIDAMFYLGGAYGNLGRYYGMTNSWLKAYWYGRKGKNYLKDVIEISPHYYDAYLGLGIYHYYADILPKFIKAISFLFGIEGNKAKGLEELKLAISKGASTKTKAMLFLGNIYLDFEGDNENALIIFKELVQKYPNNFSLALSLGNCYKNLHQQEKAIAIYENVLKLETVKKYARDKNYIYINLAAAHFEMNNFDKALSTYLQISSNSQLKKRDKSGLTAWAIYQTGECYSILDSVNMAQKYYRMVNEDANKYAYKFAQERLKQPLTKSGTGLIKGRNYIQQKKYGEAEKILISAVQLERGNGPSPDDDLLGQMYFYLGKSKFGLNEFENAIDSYDQALALKNVKSDWIKPWSRFRKGECYKKLGKINEAKKAFELAAKYEDGRLKMEIEKALIGIDQE